MLQDALERVKKFRGEIYRAIKYRADAFMDLLDSLCSNVTANTPVKLSLNAHHQRTYNSITDVVSEFHKGETEQSQELFGTVLKQVFEENRQRNYYLFGADCTPAPRPQSQTVSTNRGFVYSPNPIADNKPITIGHKYSTLFFLPPKAENSPPWVLPVSVRRVATDQNDTVVGAEQLAEVLVKVQKENPTVLCVNVVDSGYCKPDYIEKLHGGENHNVNLVTIVRARSNRVVWQRPKERRSIYGNKRGHERWYGDVFRFNDPESWHEPDNTFEKSVLNKKEKKCIIRISGWNNMLIRQKNGISMQKHPFRLCSA